MLTIFLLKFAVSFSIFPLSLLSILITMDLISVSGRLPLFHLALFFFRLLIFFYLGHVSLSSHFGYFSVFVSMF